VSFLPIDDKASEQMDSSDVKLEFLVDLFFNRNRNLRALLGVFSDDLTDPLLHSDIVSL